MENDLIYRQDAIGALDAEYRCTGKSDDWDGLETAMLIIENLPSAQPDFNTVEKIDKAYDDGYKCGHLQAKCDYETDMRGKQNDVPDINDGDTISRRAAIDLANELYQGTDIIETTYNGVRKAIMAFINLVPPAQPEITRCKDCKFYTSMIPTEGVEICSLAGRHLGDDGFCSEAERREE